MSPARPSRRQIKRRRRGAAALLVVIAIAIAYLVLSATVLAPVDTHGATVAHVVIHSRAVGEDLDVGVVVPDEARTPQRPPLLVFLHGKGGTVGDLLGDGPFSGDEPFFAALAKLGPGAPVIAVPADDGDSYWHDRSTGGWATYLIDEVIPEIGRRFETDPDRVAIG